MPIVEVNGQEIEFPDSMSPDAIKQVLREKFPPQQSAAPMEKQSAAPEAGSALQAAGIGMAGGAVPFGNVITSGIGAALAKPFTDESFSELYNQAQQFTKSTQEANPAATLAGNIGGIATTLPIALPKLGAFVNAPIAKGTGMAAKAANLAGRAVKGAAVTAPIGGLYSAGEADSGQRLEAFKEGAALSGAIAAGLPVAGAALAPVASGIKNIYKGATAKSIEDLTQVSDNLFNAATEKFAKMKSDGATFTPLKSKEIANNVFNDVAKDGPLNKGLHGKTISLLEDLSNASNSPDFSLVELDQWRRLFGQVARNKTPDGLEDARKATLAIKKIDEIIENISNKDLSKGSADASKTLVEARKIYSQASKYDRILDIVEKSQGDANYLKRELNKLAENPKKTMGFSGKEIEALKQASKQSTGEGILKMLGKFGFDLGGSRAVGNTALPVMGGVGGAFADPITGVLIPTIGTAARSSQKAIARAKADELLKVIEKGGKISLKELEELPAEQKKSIIDKIMNMPANIARSAIMMKEGK